MKRLGRWSLGFFIAAWLVAIIIGTFTHMHLWTFGNLGVMLLITWAIESHLPFWQDTYSALG